MIGSVAKALNETHKYLHTMGSKVAPTKSYNFASHQKTRQWLKDTVWEHIQAKIGTVADFRYLGAHLTTRSAVNSGTLNKRWGKTCQQLRRLRYCPADVESKVKVILAKIYAGALYGVEAAQASPQKVAKLSAAVIDAFRSRNNNHNADRFFATISESKNDIDPMTQIFCRRVMQTRRTSCKKEGAADRFKTTLHRYATRHKQGSKWPKWFYQPTSEDQKGPLNFPIEQPHPSTKEYDKEWDKEIQPVGPIGLLIESIVWHGMAIDTNMKMWQPRGRTDRHSGDAIPELETSRADGCRQGQNESRVHQRHQQHRCQRPTGD